MDVRTKAEELKAEILARQAELTKLRADNPQAFPVVEQPDWHQSSWHESDC